MDTASCKRESARVENGALPWIESERRGCRVLARMSVEMRAMSVYRFLRVACLVIKLRGVVMEEVVEEERRRGTRSRTCIVRRLGRK